MGLERKVAPPWRWVQTESLPGPENMAIDETLLESYRENPDRPIFRAYTWNPAAVSLGRFQVYDQDIIPQVCEQRNVPLVRRITGGGAIFHDHELTYSLVCGRRDLGNMTVKESFRVLCSFLIDAYRSLGLEAAFAADLLPFDKGIGLKTVHCFSGREPYDILVDGRKLGGNAQRRIGDLVFQHGSIPLTLDLAKQNGLFATHALPHRPSVAALYDFLDPGIVDLIGILRKCFAARMGIRWEAEPLSRGEWERAMELTERKYRSDRWNREGKDADS